MRLGGFQKLTLIDFPGTIAATVFTVGCGFRCPFCHNPELVLPEKFPPQNEMEKEFFEHLEKRKGKLEGVCITGGEPTIQIDIIEFIEKIKKMGFKVKLDSNGTRPDVLAEIIKRNMVDYIAMDIKNSQENYDVAIGMHIDIEEIEKSVKMIMASGIDYEFRTTVVPGIHVEQDFIEIAKWIKGAHTYFLQEYRAMMIIDQNLKEKTVGKSLDLKKIKLSMQPYLEKVYIRQNN